MTSMSKFSVIGIIPARWDSLRFPGKPIHLIADKPMIQHVWERAQLASGLDEIIIATDDERIKECAQSFGAKTVIVKEHCATGTDRVAIASQSYSQFSHVINIQGDEPCLNSKLLENLISYLKEQPHTLMATAAHPLEDIRLISDPNIVKVVLNQQNQALYFSRSSLPYIQNKSVIKQPTFRHIGIYAYQREFLQTFAQWQSTPLEQTESLEQLRALENGVPISVILTDTDEIGGVDTLEQAQYIDKILTKNRA